MRISQQRRSVTELDALKRLQAETEAELDALLHALLDRASKKENCDCSETKG